MTHFKANSAILSFLKLPVLRLACFYLGFALLLSNEVCAQDRNPYKLPIISTRKAYKHSIKGNPGMKMVKVEDSIHPFFAEVPYAGTNNFTGIVLYKNPTFFLRGKALHQLKMAQDSLSMLGLSFYFFDTYRPYAVTLKMWEKVPDDRYAANPANGSGHNRGVAVDLTLADLKTGKPLPMPTGFDNFSDTAHYAFLDLPEDVLRNRTLLRGVMEHFGFRALETEWWHFYLPEPKQYPLMDLSFKQLRNWQKKKW
jgi:D-alanyl-D-alanine dipeptidase